MLLYTNRTPKDTIRNAFYQHAENVEDIYIACPFFSYDSLIEELLKEPRQIKIIVRLGPATPPNSLQKIINKDGVQIRYFTSPLFHSKLYIFGNRAALIGSANFTDAGFQSNRELCVTIPSDDERFDELLRVYQSYWTQADVLTRERLEEYAKIFAKSGANSGDKNLESSVMDVFGDLWPSEGIQADKKKESKEKVFLEAYRRTYQEFLSAFREVEGIYQKAGKRKKSEDVVPLRIEIDQFFNFIREFYAKGDSYKYQKLLSKDKREELVKGKLEEWFETNWPYLENNIPKHYAQISKTLTSGKSIQSATMEEIVDALLMCHSIHDRLRFFTGGLNTLKEVILKENSEEQLKKVVSYLLYGEEDFITRMGNCIFNPEMSVSQVGRSGIQELLGWVNNENVPICNGRTVKALRYLGYNVVVFID